MIKFNGKKLVSNVALARTPESSVTESEIRSELGAGCSNVVGQSVDRKSSVCPNTVKGLSNHKEKYRVCPIKYRVCQESVESRVLRVVGGCAKTAFFFTQPLRVHFSKICSNGPKCQSGGELGRIDQD